MGISASFSRQTSQQRFEAIFVDDVLREGCHRLKQMSSYRRAFVAYIKSGLWESEIYDSKRHVLPECLSVWSKYGYKKHCQVGDVVPGKSSKTCKSTNSSERPSDVSLYSASETTELELDSLMMFTDPTYSRALLIVLLYPIFESIQSASGRANLVKEFSLSSITENLEYPSTTPKQRDERLLETLLALAAACDESDLLDYLADPCTCVLEDYMSAIESLPVKLMVGRVEQESRELPVVYSNFQLDGSSKEAMGLRLCEPDVVGQDLHVLCGNMCSPGSAQQLERAVFAGKPFKTSIALPKSRCKLLAVHPINGTQPGKVGTPFYSFSLESKPFLDPHFLPTEEGCERNGEEVPFCQVEVMLDLLPMLIRCRESKTNKE